MDEATVREPIDVMHRCGHVETYEHGQGRDSWALCTKCHASWEEGQVKAKMGVKPKEFCIACHIELVDPFPRANTGNGLLCWPCYSRTNPGATYPAGKDSGAPEFVKPPLGIRSRKFWLEDRAKELCDAIKRYLEAGMVPLGCWVHELSVICTELALSSAEANR